MSETIAAISTPNAVGGISVVRLSGDAAFSVADRIFTGISGKPLCTMKGYRAAYGELHDAQGKIDTGVALVFRAPKSYTGENVVEFSCHGGIVLTRRVLRAAMEAGARLAQPGEFTKRDFLNGKLSLTQAESVLDLIQSQNEQALNCSNAALDGSLYRRISAIREELVAETAHITAWVDFPEEDVDEVKRQELASSLKKIRDELRELLATFDIGRVIHSGVNTVIVGKPNVGKSTLMNLLAGCEKSIVTDIAGTTRDIVEETVNLGDVVLRLADTAGIRHTDDLVERVGVERAKQRIATADLVLLLLDVSQPLDEEDIELMRAVRGKPTVVLLNKEDLGNDLDEEYIRRDFQHIVKTSLKKDQDTTQLNRAVSELFRLNHLDTSQPMLANERQRDCAARALSQVEAAVDETAFGMTLDAVDLCIQDAVSALLELTGEAVSEVVVEEVFSKFCVGK